MEHTHIYTYGSRLAWVTSSIIFEDVLGFILIPKGGGTLPSPIIQPRHGLIGELSPTGMEKQINIVPLALHKTLPVMAEARGG